MSIFAKKRSDAGRARQQENNESSLWEKDKDQVFNSCATFSVKVLGEIPVEEARGIEACEFAVKDMPYKKNKIKGQFKIYSHGLTFVEEKTNSLAINQPIEKVSFCCALPSNERIFAYISRDGFARQWVCHAFVTTKGITADRVSHACACAFTACLQKKQLEHKKHGLPPICPSSGNKGGLDMRRVRSSGEVLEKGAKGRGIRAGANMRPLGGSTGDLLEQSLEIRDAAAKQASSTEMNGTTFSESFIPRPKARDSGYAPYSKKIHRLSLPDTNPFHAPVPLVDPWEPALSPSKKQMMDPFDPFPLRNTSGQLLPPPSSIPNPFTSLPMDSKVEESATNPFL